MSFRVDQIDHVEMLAEDPQALLDWYHQVLGLEEIGRWDPHPIMIGSGGTQLAVFDRGLTSQAMPGKGRQTKEPPPGFYRRVAFRTDADGFATAQRHLRELGVAFEGPIDHQVSRSIYFEDPEGHPLEITSYWQPAWPYGNRK